MIHLIFFEVLCPYCKDSNLRLWIVPGEFDTEQRIAECFGCGATKFDNTLLESLYTIAERTDLHQIGIIEHA